MRRNSGRLVLRQPTKAVVIGGGLAGLVTAAKLAEHEVRAVIVDRPLDAADDKLGGFARFSGAKFSLPPAGRGLEPLVSSRKVLQEACREMLQFLGLDSAKSTVSESLRSDETSLKASNAVLRGYDSIVLTSEEIESLLDKLASRLADSSVMQYRGECTSIQRASDSDLWVVAVTTDYAPIELTSEAVFFAGGRLGASLLLGAGAKSQPGKGLDLGVRFEFLDKNAVAPLRALGPDAKILENRTRTFCLNYPGHVYYYSSENMLLPGGVVADHTVTRANFGMMMRLDEKEARLSALKSAAPSRLSRLRSPQKLQSLPFGHLELSLSQLIGEDVVAELTRLSETLSSQGLVSWAQEYLVHFPLMDWHWPVFSLPGKLETSEPRLYAVGDVSGHARGLLQAAVMGDLAVQEYLEC